MRMHLIVGLLSMLVTLSVAAENKSKARLISPSINENSWVLIEIWPEVDDISLSAYFLDFSYDKNKNLCEASMRIFDRDSKMQGQKQKRKMNSYRLCMSVNDARAQNYIER